MSLCGQLQAELVDLPAPAPMLEQLLVHYGRLDALVNDVSAFLPIPLGTVAPPQRDALFASTARAPFFLSQAAIPALHELRGGIDIAERPLAEHRVLHGQGRNGAAMTRSLALQLGPQIHANGSRLAP